MSLYGSDEAALKKWLSQSRNINTNDLPRSAKDAVELLLGDRNQSASTPYGWVVETIISFSRSWRGRTPLLALLRPEKTNDVPKWMIVLRGGILEHNRDAEQSMLKRFTNPWATQYENAPSQRIIEQDDVTRRRSFSPYHPPSRTFPLQEIYEERDSRGMEGRILSASKRLLIKEREIRERRALWKEDETNRVATIAAGKTNRRKAKRDSFMESAGTLGAGAGLAGAASAIATDNLQETGSEKSHEQLERDEKFPGPIRPSIDPQYGDLLSLPPSRPASSHLEPVDDVPELPPSRPSSLQAARVVRDPSAEGEMTTRYFPSKSSTTADIPLQLNRGGSDHLSKPVLIRSQPTDLDSSRTNSTSSWTKEEEKEEEMSEGQAERLMAAYLGTFTTGAEDEQEGSLSDVSGW